MKPACLLATVVFVATVACVQDQRVLFPSSVDAIELRKTGLRITNTSIIVDILGFLSSPELIWNESWHTFPTPVETLVLKFGDDELGYVWMGTDWCGTIDVDGEQVIVQLPDHRMARLRALLEQKPN